MTKKNTYSTETNIDVFNKIYEYCRKNDIFALKVGQKKDCVMMTLICPNGRYGICMVDADARVKLASGIDLGRDAAVIADAIKQGGHGAIITNILGFMIWYDSIPYVLDTSSVELRVF